MYKFLNEGTVGQCERTVSPCLFANQPPIKPTRDPSNLTALPNLMGFRVPQPDYFSLLAVVPRHEKVNVE